MKSRPDRPDYAHIDRRYRPRQRAIGLPSVGGRGHGRRRSRFWPWGWVAVLLCLVIGMSRGGAIAALDPLAQRIPPGPNESGAVVVANPTIATEGETQPIDQASDFPTSADASISSSSVTELRLQGHHRQAIGMVLRSLGVPEVLTRTLQREDFPRLTLIAIGLEPLDNSEKFDRNTFPARVAMAVEAGHRLSEDQRLQLRELADSFQAIGELDLVEPLLRYLLDTSDRDGERAALYERLGSFHGAQAQWHENYQEDLTTAQYQAALAAYDQASSLVQGDRDARLRLQIARLRTELAEQRYGMQNLPTDLEDYAELPDLTARLNTLAQGFHTVYRELVNTQQDTATPQTIAMQLDLASQLACLHSLASPTVQTLGAAPTVRHCAAPNWPQPLPIAAQILDDRRDLLARATRDSVALSEQQPPDTLAAMIAQRFQVQALLLTGDIAAGELTPSIVAETIGKLEQSLDKPESMELPDLRVQLLWQAGRIAIAADQPKLARQYYAQAITEFQPLRIDLGSLTLDWRYNFRDAIAPLYQDYLALLLPPPEASPMTHNDPSVGLAVPTDSQDLETAIATLQGLQLAELDDFFGEACAIPEQFKIEQLDREEYRHVALLATVVLPDRTETILTFLNDRTTPTTTSSDPPSRQWLRYSAPVRQSGVRIELEQLLESLKDSNGFRIDKRTQEVYQHYMQAAIAGMEAVTPPNTIDTILFLPDGGFRSIPLGALRASADDPYLVERYDIAVIPSFDLITIDPENQVRSRLRTLAVGRSKFENTPASSRSTSRLSVTTPMNPDQSLSDLDYVESEIQGIVDLLPQVSYLLNETFLSDTFASTIASRRYDVAHIATHGSFGALAAQTFIVAQDGPISFDRLGQLLRSNDPTRTTDLDLVIFSACQTAEGNDRAVLGMAGMGLRAGVRSTIGSLWNVDDRSTSLIMQRFYRYRRDGLSKVAALSAAQRDAIANRLDPTTTNPFGLPYYWSPFILVGDW